MRALGLVVVVWSALGHAAPSSVPAPAPKPVANPVKPPPTPSEVPEGHDFTAMGKALSVVGACSEGTVPPGIPAAVHAKHCKGVKEVQERYRKRWLSRAQPFFADKVPRDIPKKVVYPFAGGDLSTALTVYPDADEITTMSLEPAGDPRTLEALTAKGMTRELTAALATIRDELHFIYLMSFSNTMNLIDAMRQGSLPTQLVFGLSALHIHGYELVGLRYFKLDEAGTIHYLDDAAVAAAPPVDVRSNRKNAERNRLFANAEVQYRKPGGRIQVFRHIQVNLDDLHLNKDPRVKKHLESKGSVAAMTKAASYLLSWDSFSSIRSYLTQHAVWMVSDATGIPPKHGKSAGFTYETYGSFLESHMEAGRGVAAAWRQEWKAQPKRVLPFRFGYPDKKLSHHLVIIKKKA
ncbi:MAG: hypothetical protein WKG01_22455 [Kofleriaceae bacterium]